MLHFATKLAKFFITSFIFNMKITPINILQDNTLPQLNAKQTFESKVSKAISFASMTQPVFQAHSVKYLKAKGYLNQENLKRQSKGVFEKFQKIFTYDLKKLDGIQEGIKVFKNLTMKEIAFILTTVTEFALIRGCRNNCSHCYADAKPPIKNTEEMANSMLWEDFVSLTDGIKELNQRLGFNASDGLIHNSGRYLTAFHDSDCSDVCIKDSIGKEHDYTEIAQKLYDAMGVRVIFDTSGWNLTDKKTQMRMEKFVEHYSNPKNRENLDDINISFNPFHAIYTKSVELDRAGKKDLAKKMRNIYTDRMANALYTFTPLLKYDDFKLLGCILPEDKNFDGFTGYDILELLNETLEKLEVLYTKDYENEKKYIKSEDNTKSNLLKYKDKLAVRYITFSEKAKKIFGNENLLAEDADDKLMGSLAYTETEPSSIEKYRNYFVGIIDSNGKYYLTNFELTIPTELKLNFKNNKETAQIKPYLIKEKMLMKDEINSF